ncbi:MAG: response regulator [Candidatus Odinarchaeota archaeon]
MTIATVKKKKGTSRKSLYANMNDCVKLLILLRILVIEDNVDHQLLYEKKILKLDPESCVTCVGSALEAIDIISNTDSVYDLILLDYMLPDMDGIAFLHHLNETGRLDAPVIMITGQGDQETAVSALKAGAYDYLVKPRLDKLPDIINSLLAPKESFSEKSIFLCSVKMDEKRGPVIIETDMLPFSTDDFLLKYSALYITAIGQGDKKNEGLFGPLPAYGDYLAMIHGKNLPDRSQVKGHTFMQCIVFFHRQFIQYFQHYRQIEQVFSEELEKITDISGIDDSYCANLKQKIYSALAIYELTVSLSSRNKALENENREANLMNMLLLGLIPSFARTFPVASSKDSKQTIPEIMKAHLTIIELLQSIKSSEEVFTEFLPVKLLQSPLSEDNKEESSFRVDILDEQVTKAISFCQKDNLKRLFLLVSILARKMTTNQQEKTEIKVDTSTGQIKFILQLQVHSEAGETIKLFKSLKWHPDMSIDTRISLLILLGMKSFLRKHRGQLSLNYSPSLKILELVFNLPVIGQLRSD